MLVVRCLLLVLLDLLVLFLSDDREHPNVLVNFEENCIQNELGQKRARIWAALRDCIQIDQKRGRCIQKLDSSSLHVPDTRSPSTPNSNRKRLSALDH